MTKQKVLTPYNWLLSMINSIGRATSLREEDKVLMVYQLNSKKKMTAFNEWVKTKIADGKFQVTAEEVMHQTAIIDRTIK